MLCPRARLHTGADEGPLSLVAMACRGVTVSHGPECVLSVGQNQALWLFTYSGLSSQAAQVDRQILEADGCLMERWCVIGPAVQRTR